MTSLAEFEPISMMAVRFAIRWLLLFLELFELEFQFVDILDIVRIGDDTVDRTDGDTLRFVEVADTLCTAVRIDNIDRIVLFNGFVGTLFSACIAGDTLICNQ